MTAFVNHQRQDSLFARPAFGRSPETGFSGRGATAVDRDAAFEPFERVSVRYATHPDLVLAGDAVPGMRQPGGQLAIAHQQQQPF